MLDVAVLKMVPEAVANVVLWFNDTVGKGGGVASGVFGMGDKYVGVDVTGIVAGAGGANRVVDGDGIDCTKVLISGGARSLTLESVDVGIAVVLSVAGLSVTVGAVTVIRTVTG